MAAIDVARRAMQVITQNVSQQTLSRTSYCAMVVKMPNGNRAVMIAEAGATASGISGTLVDKLDTALQLPIIPCADPVPGQGTWHMNDAEQQALRTFFGNTGFQGASIEAVVANRTICESCKFTLTQHGMNVTGAEAVAP